MEYFAHKAFCVTVHVAEEDFIALTYSGEFPIKKGEKYKKDLYGNVEPVTQEYIDRNFVRVQRREEVVRRRGYSMKELEEAYKQSWQDDDEYIQMDASLTKNKAL